MEADEIYMLLTDKHVFWNFVFRLGARQGRVDVLDNHVI